MLTPAEILAFPLDKLFSELKLPALVPMRSNGLTAMVRRIQAVAKLAADSEPPAQPATQPLPLIPLTPSVTVTWNDVPAATGAVGPAAVTDTTPRDPP